MHGVYKKKKPYGSCDFEEVLPVAEEHIKKTIGNGRKILKTISLSRTIELPDGILATILLFAERGACECVCKSVIFRGFSMLSASPFHQIGIRVIPSILVFFFLFSSYLLSGGE